MERVTIAVLGGKVAGAIKSAEKLRTALKSGNSATVTVLDAATPEDLEYILSIGRDGSAVIVYDPADVAVAQGLANGTSPSVALSLWKSGVEPQLSVIRRHRRILALIASDAVDADPQDCAGKIAGRFGLAGNAEARRATGATVSPDALCTAWQEVLAKHAVNIDPVAKRLNGEMEAAALPVTRQLGDPNAAYAELQTQEQSLARTREECQRLKRELADLAAQTQAQSLSAAQGSVVEAECALLIQQLGGVQRELTELYVTAAGRKDGLDRQTKS